LIEWPQKKQCKQKKASDNNRPTGIGKRSERNFIAPKLTKNGTSPEKQSDINGRISPVQRGDGLKSFLNGEKRSNFSWISPRGTKFLR